MTYRKKLIEVALPLEAINEASAREKSIRHGHPSTLHLWWARRPLAAARAVIFTSLVDDPDDPDAPPDFVAACRALPRGKNAAEHDTPRMRLFDFIERLVQWESTTDEATLATARTLIRLATGDNPPPLLDPFAGGGSIPLEAQRLGLEAHAGDLNPVAVMINKALIEIPPRFAGQVPVSLGVREQGLGAREQGLGNREVDDGRDQIVSRSGGVAAGDGADRGGLSSVPASAEDGGVSPDVATDAGGRVGGGEYRGGTRASDAPGLRALHLDSPGLAGRGGDVSDSDRAPEFRDGAAGEQGRRPGRGSGPHAQFAASSPPTTLTPNPHPLTPNPHPLIPIPYPGSSGLAADVRHYGEWMRDRAAERIGDLYPDLNGETVIAWLWARTVKCPNPACGAQMPLVRSFDLSTKKGKRAWVEPQVDPRTRAIRFEVKQAASGKGPEGTVNRQGATCIACGTPVKFDHIRSEGRAGRMSAQLMAIVTEGKGGRNYHSPEVTHVEVAESATPEWKPDHPLPHNPRDFKTPNYGMTTFADLFTPRQLVALTTFSDLVGEARAQIERDALAAGLPADDIPLRDGGRGAKAYAEAVSVYLAFGVDRGANYWSSLTVWADFIVQTFGRQALPMVWDFSEANPFSDSSGNWDGAIRWIEKCITDAIPATRPGYATQHDAAQALKVNAGIPISTDPPYYDNIGYADLSDFFYIWMRNNLKTVYPDLFGTLLVPKTAELIATPYRFGGSAEAAKQHFESGLEKAFARMRKVIPPEIPLTVYYAFKQQEVVLEEGAASTGWETMLSGLLGAGYSIVGTWPMRTERDQGLKTGSNVLASSIVLVCRPRPDDAPAVSRRAFLAELRAALPAALKEMQSGNIAPVDLAQASIGPGMAVYSRYRQVLEANGEPLTVRAALQLINQTLDEYLAEQEGDLDGDSRFAVAWFEQYAFKEGAFGDADVLARAKNTSVDGLVQAGVARSGAGKVRLIPWREMDPGWNPREDKRPTVWEATHHLIERLNVYGEEGAAGMLAEMPAELAANARDLAYRLYNICERKGWAEYAREYNALVVSWGASRERAATMRTEARQGRLFEG